ncbi:MAG TPA: polysaccharide biosynthesis protein, partial [Cellvibrionaceae bacterium]|nr:polysaccharide biosynthesis protein [Cellvibrionaceae bacterium]
LLDLAEAISSEMPTKIVGIRPGEKQYETMCRLDDSHLTLVFDDHVVNTPTNKLFRYVNYEINNLGERGHAVPRGFSYNSGNNPHVLNVDEIRQLHEMAEV